MTIYVPRVCLSVCLSVCLVCLFCCFFFVIVSAVFLALFFLLCFSCIVEVFASVIIIIISSIINVCVCVRARVCVCVLVALSFVSLLQVRSRDCFVCLVEHLSSRAIILSVVVTVLDVSRRHAHVRL